MLKKLCIVLCYCATVCLGSELLTYRLSATEAIPKKYALTFKPDFDNKRFDATVSIYVDTTNSLKGITLHSHELNISEVYINQIRGYYDEETEERITVKYNDSSIQPGEHVIKIKYSGKINTDNGFIKALYQHKEVKSYVYVTDLEPTRARKVFPCFDEPAFKASFNIRLISPNDTFKAISNMPEINRFKTSKGVVYDFEPSVKMATYLVSFAFTNFPYYEEILEHRGRKIPIRIYTVNATKENNEFAINCTKTALTFYSEYTNISYPLPKLDMIEYKRNDSAATENWGLITFREGLLTPSLNIYNKFQIKLVVFHELSHFWFGNLVTNAWWNDIWLQEGFATYMSYKLSAHTNGIDQLREMKSFNFNDYFETEIYEKSQPIISYLPEQNQILHVFNGLVYEKASAILLMLEDTVGKYQFQEIIRRFLCRHAYSTATTNDFITTVEEVVPDKPLRTFLESYFFQSKFPVIYVDIIDNSTYILKQYRCETIQHESESPAKWTIPISYITDTNVTNNLWFYRDMDELIFEETDAKWIIFNPKGNGMYKTVLSMNMWSQIINNFELMDLSTVETIISDAFYSFRFNKIHCNVIVQLMEKVQSPGKKTWLLFFDVYDHLKQNLYCHDHKEAATLLWKFLKRRFLETDYAKKPEFRPPTNCDSDSVLHDEEYLKNLNECSIWIKENLQEDSNTIKQNL